MYLCTGGYASRTGRYDYWLLKFDTQIAHIALLLILMAVCMMVGGIL